MSTPDDSKAPFGIEKNIIEGIMVDTTSMINT
jgi:hypothetical protein